MSCAARLPMHAEEILHRCAMETQVMGNNMRPMWPTRISYRSSTERTFWNMEEVCACLHLRGTILYFTKRDKHATIDIQQDYRHQGCEDLQQRCPALPKLVQRSVE